MSDALTLEGSGDRLPLQYNHLMYSPVYVCVLCACFTEADTVGFVYVYFAVLVVVYSKVRVEGDGVFVKAETSKLAQFRQTMTMGKGQAAEDPRTFLIIGGGTNAPTANHTSLRLPWYPVTPTSQDNQQPLMGQPLD